MRIIAGELRHRRLVPPPEGASTRPIPDRVKESLFGLLRGHCEGASVFDCFAGTGAMGLEAVSRGAARCVFVERDRLMASVLEKNVRALGVEDRCEVVCGDALGVGALARAPRPLTLAFFDPPYPMMEDPLQYRRVMAQLGKVIELLTDDGFAVLRTPWPLSHADAPAQAAEPAPPRRTKRPGRRDWRRELDDADRAERRARRVEPEVAEELVEPAAPAEPARRTPADLTLAGATGPETHTYRSMAVHLYMRRR